MKKNRWPRLPILAMVLAAMSFAGSASAEDTMICCLSSIVQKDRDGNLVRIFATEDAIGQRLVGEMTDDPSKLRAYVTVARNRLYIYSNFRSKAGFPTKIMTDRVDVGLATLAHNLLLVGKRPLTMEECREALPRMTFFFDERLWQDPHYGRLELDGVPKRTIAAYAMADVITRVADGQVSLEVPGRGSVPIRGLTRSLVGKGGQLSGPLEGLEGRTWLLDTSKLDDDKMAELTKDIAQIDRVIRREGGPGVHAVYSQKPWRARGRLFSPIDGKQVVVRNCESLLRADLGVIAKRILERRAARGAGGRHVQFTIGHFDPMANPLDRIGRDEFEADVPKFRVLGMCNPNQMTAFLAFAHAAIDAGDLGILLPAAEVDIPAMTLVALAYEDKKDEETADLYPVRVAPLAIREQLQLASKAAADKLRRCLEGGLTGSELEVMRQIMLGKLEDIERGKRYLLFAAGPQADNVVLVRLRYMYGPDADDVIEMFQGAVPGKLDRDRIKRTIEALQRGFEGFIHVSSRIPVPEPTDTARVAT